jgi:hypothetical protein
MVFALARLGCLEDRRVRLGIDWITRYQRFDDGDGAPPKGWPYERYERCWGKQTCYYGVVKALKALSEIPEERRTPAVKDTLGRCAEYLLKHRVFRSSGEPARVGNEDWTRLGFPLMWKTDALEVLLLLGRLGVRDRRMRDAVDLVVSKRGPDGRWAPEKSFSGRFQVPVERAGRPSKWVTLRALTALKLLEGFA